MVSNVLKVLKKANMTHGSMLSNRQKAKSILLDWNEPVDNYYCTTNHEELNKNLRKLSNIDSCLDIESFHGLDEAIENTCLGFLNYDDSCLTTSPTYGHIDVAVLRAHGKIKKVDISKYINEKELYGNLICGFELILKMQKIKMVYLVNPNNPTGNFVSIDVIEEIVSNNKNVTFFIDEAYTEFTSCTHSVIELCKKYQNIVVGRTLSKYYYSPDCRCGYIIGQHKTIDVIRKFKNFKCFDLPSYDAINRRICSYIENKTEFDSRAKAELLDFASLQTQLERIGYNVIDCNTNFMLIEIKDAYNCYLWLLSHGIYVRYFENLSGYIRVSNSTSYENFKFFIKRMIEYKKVEE